MLPASTGRENIGFACLLQTPANFDPTMSTSTSNLLGTYIGRAEAMENVVDTLLPLLTLDQKEVLANALTGMALELPEGTPQNWQHDPEYTVALEGVYKSLLVELWRP